MQINELIERLKVVAMIEPNGTVYLMTEKGTYDFTGLSVSDIWGNVELYVAMGDKEA